MLEGKRITIRKKSGGVRHILAPTGRTRHLAEKLAHRSGLGRAAQDLAGLVARECPGYVVAALPGGVSVGEAAALHAGAEATACFDLRNFFDHVGGEKFDKLFGFISKDDPLAEDVARILARPLMAWAGKAVTIGDVLPMLQDTDGCLARQGLACSPLVASVAFFPADLALARWAKRRGLRVSRYVDDLTVSGPEAAVREALREVARMLEGMGWEVNRKKTSLFLRRGGAAVVCGVSVRPDGLRATREARRRLRAAMHQAPDSPATRGLREWCEGLGIPARRRAEAQAAIITAPVAGADGGGWDSF